MKLIREPMEEYSEYFTSRKPSRFGTKVIRFWHQRMLHIASRYIPCFPELTILEFGAGHGFVADICREKNIAYCGHEMNAQQAAALQQQGFTVTQAKIPPIPPASDGHIIWLSHVLEHAANYQQAREMLLACYSHLKKESFIVIIAPDLHHWQTAFWCWDWSHGFPTTLNRVEQLLHETGFHIVKATHHTATFTHPLLAWLISTFFRLFPVTLLDYFCEKITGRRFFQAFMSIYGYRQILLIGNKQD